MNRIEKIITKTFVVLLAAGAAVSMYAVLYTSRPDHLLTTAIYALMAYTTHRQAKQDEKEEKQR